MKANDLTPEFFRERTVIDPATQCWEMQNTLDPNGYGRPAFRGRRLFAHRASYEAFVGPVADGMFVCHHCDNPRCVNPRHLFLGTAAENNADRDRKGRGAKPPAVPPERRARGSRNGSRTKPETVPRGEQHGMAKLDEAGAKTAIALLHAGWPQQMIARRLGIRQTSVSNLKNAVTWAHLPRPWKEAC
jgi:hypothetical protein